MLLPFSQSSFCASSTLKFAASSRQSWSFLRKNPLFFCLLHPRCFLLPHKPFFQKFSVMPSNKKYTDPKLRDQVKEEVQQSDKGGAPGQWSARKAQFMASEYKKRGGSYNTDPSEKDDSQKNLDKWGDEKWQTKEGSGEAKQADGTQKRYLPKKAWENMDDEEKEATDKKKTQESKQGKQFVGNTKGAKDARKKATKGKGDNKDAKDREEEDGEEPESANEEKEGEEEKKDENVADEKKRESKEQDEEPVEEKANSGRKRTRGSNANTTASKKQKSSSGDKNEKAEGEKGEKSRKGGKTIGSKHMSADAPAKQASASRLPKKGQKVTWKAMPGWVEGHVLEIVTSDKTVEGKKVKASKEDPRIVLKSHGPSGKVAVHKADGVHFD